MSNFLLTSLLGLSLAALLTLNTSKTTQRRVMIGLAVLAAFIAIPQLWQNSMEWRVRNVPAMATASERESVAAVDELKAANEKLKRAYQATAH